MYFDYVVGPHSLKELVFPPQRTLLTCRDQDGRLAIEMSADDYLKMINGELHGARAFASGRGRLRGPVRLAMRMQRLFPLEKRIDG